jgi:NAD(P)-dependent dehydrogenase (short-subunit alcohol dehydrogenase family)
MEEKGSYNNNGRVAVITGSSKGIGKAIAMEFVMNARHEQQLKQAAEEISNSIEDEKKIVSLVGDVSQEHICVSLVEKAVKQFGKIDVMINNAGVGGESKKIHELTEKDWDEVIDINLKGAFLCTREAVKNMVSRTKCRY